MSRLLRIEYENTSYPVIHRGRRHRLIFHEDGYYQAFLQGIEEAYWRFGIGVHAYYLMSNHYHLLLKTPQGGLSRAMHHINGLYTQHITANKTADSLFR